MSKPRRKFGPGDPHFLRVLNRVYELRSGPNIGTYIYIYILYIYIYYIGITLHYIRNKVLK